MTTSRKINTPSIMMKEALAKEATAKGLMLDTKENKQYIRLAGGFVRILDEELDFSPDEKYVSIGRSPFSREALVINPNSPRINALYGTLCSRLTVGEDETSKLKKVIVLVRETLPNSNVDNIIKKWTGETDTISMSVTNGLIFFDALIEAKTGCCRHKSALIACLVSKLKKDKHLPSGKVYVARGSGNSSGSEWFHSWIIYRPDIRDKKPIDAYWLDAAQFDKPYLLLENQHFLVTKLGQNNFEFCVFNYLAWQPPGITYSIDLTTNTYLYQKSGEAKSTVYTSIKELGRGSYGTVHLIQNGGQAYAVKAFTYHSYNFDTRYSLSETNDFIKTVIMKGFITTLQEARINYELDNIGASFVIPEPVIIEEKETEGWIDSTKRELGTNIARRKIVTSYPKMYQIMKYVEGIKLDEFKFSSAQEVVICATKIIRAVSQIHKKMILHLDIKIGNILIYKNTSTGCLSVELIDRSLSRFSGHTLNVANLNLTYQPPEFKGETEIKAVPAQDIYNAGFVMKELIAANKTLFSSEMITKVESIATQMTNTIPDRRITLIEAETRLLNMTIEIAFARVKTKSDSEKYEEFLTVLDEFEKGNIDFTLLNRQQPELKPLIMNFANHSDFFIELKKFPQKQKHKILIILCEAKAAAYKSQFPNAEMIDRWFYVQRYLIELRNIPNDTVDINYVINGLSKRIFTVESSEEKKSTPWEAGVGANRLIETIKNKPSDLFSLLDSFDTSQIRALLANSSISTLSVTRWGNESLNQLLETLPRILRNVIANKSDIDRLFNVLCLFPENRMGDFLSRLNSDDFIRLLIKTDNYIFDKLNTTTSPIKHAVLTWICEVKAKTYLLQFPESFAIDSWSYMQRYIKDLRKKPETDKGYIINGLRERVFSTKLWELGVGANRLALSARESDSTADDFFSMLRPLSPPQMQAFLRHNKAAFEIFIIKDDFISRYRVATSETQKILLDYLISLFTEKIKEIEKPDPIDIIRRHLCETAIELIKAERQEDIIINYYKCLISDAELKTKLPILFSQINGVSQFNHLSSHLKQQMLIFLFRLKQQVVEIKFPDPIAIHKWSDYESIVIKLKIMSVPEEKDGAAKVESKEAISDQDFYTTTFMSYQCDKDNKNPDSQSLDGLIDTILKNSSLLFVLKDLPETQRIHLLKSLHTKNQQFLARSPNPVEEMNLLPTSVKKDFISMWINSRFSLQQESKDSTLEARYDQWYYFVELANQLKNTTYEPKMQQILNRCTEWKMGDGIKHYNTTVIRGYAINLIHACSEELFPQDKMYLLRTLGQDNVRKILANETKDMTSSTKELFFQLLCAIPITQRSDFLRWIDTDDYLKQMTTGFPLSQYKILAHHMNETFGVNSPYAVSLHKEFAVRLLKEHGNSFAKATQYAEQWANETPIYRRIIRELCDLYYGKRKNKITLFKAQNETKLSTCVKLKEALETGTIVLTSKEKMAVTTGKLSHLANACRKGGLTFS